MSELWIALVETRRGDGDEDAYVYGAARADSVLGAVAALTDCAEAREVELRGFEWLQTYESLHERGQESEPVREVLALLGEDGRVAMDWSSTLPADAEPDPVEVLTDQVDSLVHGWIEGGVERFGPFELGDFAFLAEVRFEGEEPSIGWAFGGDVATGALALFERAAEQARDGVDDSDD